MDVTGGCGVDVTGRGRLSVDTSALWGADEMCGVVGDWGVVGGAADTSLLGAYVTIHLSIRDVLGTLVFKYTASVLYEPGITPFLLLWKRWFKTDSTCGLLSKT